jgi:hypothetical protein
MLLRVLSRAVGRSEILRVGKIAFREKFLPLLQPKLGLPPSNSNGPALLYISTSDFLDEGRDNHFVMSRKNACHLHTKQKSNCRAIETLDSQIQRHRIIDCNLFSTMALL